MASRLDGEEDGDASRRVVAWFDFGCLRHPSLLSIISRADLVAPSFVPCSVHADL
jgi:hypothetical protein